MTTLSDLESAVIAAIRSTAFDLARRAEKAEASVPTGRRMEVIAQLCRMMWRVSEHIDPESHNPCDCVCRVRSDYRNSGEALAWMERVISAAIADQGVNVMVEGTAKRDMNAGEFVTTVDVALSEVQRALVNAPGDKPIGILQHPEMDVPPCRYCNGSGLGYPLLGYAGVGRCRACKGCQTCGALCWDDPISSGLTCWRCEAR
jgi:hypothetical protein